MPRLKEKTAAAIASSHNRRLKTGLAVGFGGEDAAGYFAAIRGGLWMSCETPRDLPFEDAQFDAVALETASVGRESVREINRVLKPEGFLYFSVPERDGKQDGYTAPEIYRIVREGFDIVDLKMPKWWKFGIGGRTITVSARKKAWKEHKSFLREGSLPFTPFRERK